MSTNKDPLRARYGDAFDSFKNPNSDPLKERYGNAFDSFDDNGKTANFEHNEVETGEYDFEINKMLAEAEQTVAQQNALKAYNGLEKKYTSQFTRLLDEMETEVKVYIPTLLPLSDRPDEIVHYFLKKLVKSRNESKVSGKQ